jgi:D-xylose transport system substrate-binding protein
MKLKKLLIIVITVIVFVSCSKSESPDNTIRIGFSAATDTSLLERWDRDIKIFTNVARELGAEVIFAKSPGNAQGQIPQIQYLLGQDIDVLVVIPQDMELLSGVIKKIMDKGIPVLSYDRPIMGVPITGYVSFDNQEVGRLLAKALLTKVHMGNFLIINGSVRDNNSFEVNYGVHEILDPYVQSGRITIIDEVWLERWSFDEARERISAVFEKTENIDAITAANDQIAGAAVSVLSELMLAGKIPVVGQDADLLACQRVVEGLQLMTVYKPIPNLAGRAAEIAVSMAKGEIPLPDQYLDNKSGVDVPFYIEKPIAVFAEQMDETVILDGFHSREDVYRNVLGQN